MHLPDGSQITGFDGFFEWACADATAETTLQEARLARFGTDVNPTCGDFLQQPPGVQEMWLEVASTASGSAIAEEDLSAVCGDRPDSSFRATAEGLQLILEDLERQALEASRVSFTWETEDHLGYTLSHTVTVGQVQGGDAPHYNDSSFLIGSTCDFDPATDALVPVVFAVTNTATGYDQLIDVSYAVQSWGGITTVTPRVAGRFSGGNECIGGYAYTGSGSTIVRIAWHDPVAPGQTVRSNQFIVLQDYYSPSHPSGNTADLSQIFVSSSFAFFNSYGDGVLLDGTQIEGTT